MNNCIRFTSFGKFAIEALACAIADAKEYDPLQPVSVVTPAGVGVYSGLHARRRLTLGGLDLNLKTLGLTNVRFLPLARVAELLGETQLTATGKRKLTDPLRREFARAALAQQPGSLQKYAHNPAVLSSLLQAFQTLASLAVCRRDSSDILSTPEKPVFVQAGRLIHSSEFPQNVAKRPKGSKKTLLRIYPDHFKRSTRRASAAGCTPSTPETIRPPQTPDPVRRIAGNQAPP